MHLTPDANSRSLRHTMQGSMLACFNALKFLSLQTLCFSTISASHSYPFLYFWPPGPTDVPPHISYPVWWNRGLNTKSIMHEPQKVSMLSPCSDTSRDVTSSPFKDDPPFSLMHIKAWTLPRLYKATSFGMAAQCLFSETFSFLPSSSFEYVFPSLSAFKPGEKKCLAQIRSSNAEVI